MMKLLVVLATVTSCTKVASQDILTHGMSAAIEVKSDASGQTGVLVTLYLGRAGDLDYIELSPGDELVAVAAGVTRQLTEISVLGTARYSTLFPTSVPDEVVAVALHRHVDPGAPGSTVTLPPPFSIAPLATPRPRTADLAITWTGSAGDPMTWSITGGCIDSAAGTIASDTGTLVVPAGTLARRAPMGTEQVPDTCQATFDLTRTRTGQLDPAFGAGGSIVATQPRAIMFTTTP